MLLAELDRGQVVQAAVRAHGVVVPPPGLDHDARLAPGAEPFDVQAFVAQPAVEALVRAVLPGLARVDMHGLDLVLGEPLQDRQADELRPVVAADERWDAALAHQAGKSLDDAARTDRARHVDRQTLAGELVDDRQTFQLLAVRAGVEDEVVSPDVIGRPGWQGARPRARDPLPAPFRGQLQLCLTPQPLGAARTHRVSLAAKKHPDASIAVARVLPRQSLHRLDCRRVLRLAL